MALISFLLAFLISLPFLLHLKTSGLARWNQVNIFSQPPKDEASLSHIVNNYLSHFSYDFLFQKGDIDMPGQFITRHSIRDFGELYLAQLPFILLGLAFLFRINKKIFLFVLMWLILYPTGSMFTLDKSAQATRSVIGVVPFQILTALGITSIYFFIKKNHRLAGNIFVIVITLVLSLSLFIFYTTYTQKYPLYSADFWGWQYGARDIVQFFVKHEDEYDEMFMAPEFNAPHIFFKFYAPNNCNKCRIGLPDELYNPNQKQLFAITPRYLLEKNIKFLTKQTIYYPNKSVAFQIGEVVE